MLSDTRRWVDGKEGHKIPAGFLEILRAVVPEHAQGARVSRYTRFGGHTLVYKVEGWGGKLSVKQWVGSETVGTDIRGSKGVEVEALMDPYRKRFEQEFEDDYKWIDAPGQLAPLVRNVLPSRRRDAQLRPVGLEMAKWLEERRKMYETNLARGRAH